MATNTRNHCDLCNQDFDTPEDLKEHNARHHSAEGMHAQTRDRSQQGSMGGSSGSKTSAAGGGGSGRTRPDRESAAQE